MFFKHTIFFLGCAASWLIVMPVLMISGGLTLLAYAVLSILSDFFTGTSQKSLDNSTAREMARRLCTGH